MAILESATRTSACDAIVDNIDSGGAAGTCVFETSGDAAVATCTFSSPAFAAAAAGVASANAVTADSAATGGDAAQVSFYDSNSTKVMECTCSTSGAEFTITSTTIGSGDTVSVTGITVTVPAS